MTTFVVIGVIGLVLLAVSLVLGDLFDGMLDFLAGDAFSSAVLGAFVSAFGFGAAIAHNAGTPGVLTIAIGIVAGVGFGWFAWWLTRLLYDGSSDATPTPQDAIGRDAAVISPIPTEGFGVVRVLLGGHSMQFNAKSERPIQPGTPVHVTGVLSPTAVTVAPLWPDDLPELPPER